MKNYQSFTVKIGGWVVYFSMRHTVCVPNSKDVMHINEVIQHRELPYGKLIPCTLMFDRKT